MQEPVISLGAFGFWIFLAVIAAGAMWTRIRKLQIRKDLILSMLEKGQPVDVEQIEKMLEPAGIQNENFQFGPKDPRSPYRMASFIFFLGGFITLFIALKQGPPMYLLALLGALPLYLAVSLWHVCNQEFANDTLATLKHTRDPREPWQHGGGWFFWIGYGTTFLAIYKYNLNIPLMIMGIISIVIAFRIWERGNREYAEGRIPFHKPAGLDEKPE